MSDQFSAKGNRLRHRLVLMAALAFTIGLGLASRKFPGLFPAALGKYPGDVLWAQMVFWRLALWALGISFADELSQLYQVPWLNQVRATTLGHLVLGSHFSWGDMVAYAVGIALVVPVARWVRPKPS